MTLIPLALALVFAPFLAGCDSPSPQFMDGAKRSITTGGMTFSVYRIGDDVEVIRTSSHAMPRKSVIHANGQTAVEQATGCAVKAGSFIGDQSVMRAALECPEAPKS